MSEKIDQFIRPELITLGSYSAHKSPDTLKKQSAEEIIKLDANENPYGCSPRVARALSRYGKYHVYPDSGQTVLRRQLQEYTGVDAGSIIAANGSGELLDYILCLLLEPGDEVINCPPTFDLYRLRTLIYRGKLVNIIRIADFSVDVKAVKAAINARTKLIILANPNNPTGNATSEGDMRELAETGIPILIDEAYYEFYGKTVAGWIEQYPNLMILRTLSKWMGLAGLRIGYAILIPRLVNLIQKIKLPYNVNVAAQVAVEESLKDMEYLRGRIAAITAERKKLFRALGRIKFLKPYPSIANFILCQMTSGNAVELQRSLQERGILVRYFAQPMLENAIRISVGTPEQTEKLISTLYELGGE